MREVIATGKTVDEAVENGCRELGLSRDAVRYEILEMPLRKLFKTLPAKVKVSSREEPQEAVSAAPKLEQAPAAPAAAPPKPQPKPAPLRAAAPPAAPLPKREKQEKQAVLPEEPEVPINLAQDAAASRAVGYLSSIFDAMGVDNYNITAAKQGDATLLRVEGDTFGNYIQVRGEIIQALSYLTDRAVNKGIDKKEDEYMRVRLDIAGYRNRREGELISLAKRTGSEVNRTHRSRTLAPMNSYERLIIHTAISEMEGLTSESIGTDVERRVVVKSTAPDATDGEDWRPGGRGRSSGSNRDRGDRGSRPNRSRNDRDRGQSRGGPRSGKPDRGPRPTSTPEREYANQQRNPDKAPVVPERRDAIKDGEDLPLYGKIEF